MQLNGVLNVCAGVPIDANAHGRGVRPLLAVRSG
jgi:hypothetical protein